MRNFSTKLITFLAALCLVFTSVCSCTKESAIFFVGPRLVSGEKGEHIFVPDIDADFVLTHVSYKEDMIKGQWTGATVHVNTDGTSFADASWFRVDVTNSTVILNLEDNLSGKKRGISITVEGPEGESYINVYQKSLKPSVKELLTCQD